MENDCVKIEIDGAPINLNPLMTREYNSKFIGQFLYYRLYNTKNCSIITKNYKEYIVELFPILLINKIYSKHYVNAIEFHKNSRMSPYNIICSIINDCHAIDEKKLFISLVDSFDFFPSVLQSSYIVACEENRPISKRTTLYKKNMISILGENAQMNFIINNSYKMTMKLFRNNFIDITCHSHGSPSNYKIKKCINEPNALIYYLTFKKEKTKSIFEREIIDIRERLELKLGKYITIIDSFLDIQKLMPKERKIKNCLVKDKIEFSLAYADYYPNKIIVEIIKQVMKNHGIFVNIVKYDNLKNFIKCRDKEDGYLRILHPIFDHAMSIPLSLVNELDVKQKEKFNNYLNKKDYFSLYGLFSSTKFSLPLGSGRNIYNIKDKYENLHFTKYGEMYLNESRGSKYEQFFE